MCCVCLCVVCVYVYVCVYVFVCVYVLRVFMCCVCLCVCVCLWACMCTCTCICIWSGAYYRWGCLCSLSVVPEDGTCGRIQNPPWPQGQSLHWWQGRVHRTHQEGERPAHTTPSPTPPLHLSCLKKNEFIIWHGPIFPSPPCKKGCYAIECNTVYGDVGT